MEEDAILHWKERPKRASDKIAQFLRSEKLSNTDKLDDLTLKLHDEAVSKIDCLSCANCCKTTVTTFTTEDVNKASKFLGVSKKSFLQQFLISDMGELTTYSTPCPFLDNDNKCKIYEVRPQACASFPHTGRKGFLSRKYAHAANYDVCPITYYVVERLKAIVF